MAEETSKRGVQAEMLVGISAVVIGVCAVAVSLYETSLMRKEQRASVLPLLELGRSYFVNPEGQQRDKQRLTLSAENVGIGPARVMDFKVTVDGKPQPTWEKAMQALLDTTDPIGYGQSSINGRTIPPERTVTMFDLADADLAPGILEQFGRLEYEACFCSVFDDCWTTSYARFGEVTAIEKCQRSDSSFQE
jgi:hypothetical protein